MAQIPATFLNECGSLEYVWVPKSVTEFVGTPILGGCIIGYTGTAAEEYADWRQEVGVNVVDFHAIDGDEHTYGEWQTVAEPTHGERRADSAPAQSAEPKQSQELSRNGAHLGRRRCDEGAH